MLHQNQDQIKKLEEKKAKITDPKIIKAIEEKIKALKKPVTK